MKLIAQSLLSLLVSCWIFASGGVQAAERPFYQGKTVTFFINFSAGGPTDIEGRIVARHLARHIAGNPPTGIKYEALKAANMASQNLNRVALLPPNSPNESILVMRQAFTSLAKDEEFIAEAKKVMRFQPRFEVGEDGEKLREKVLRAPAEVITFVQKYIEEVRK
jgi:tripartite-type tricarboxylate transporter receptor subunit TctC